MEPTDCTFNQYVQYGVGILVALLWERFLGKRSKRDPKRASSTIEIAENAVKLLATKLKKPKS